MSRLPDFDSPTSIGSQVPQAQVRKVLP
jgi:hypothetical protein